MFTNRKCFKTANYSAKYYFSGKLSYAKINGVDNFSNFNQYWKVSGIVHYLGNNVFRTKAHLTVMLITDEILRRSSRFSLHLKNISCFSWPGLIFAVGN